VFHDVSTATIYTARGRWDHEEIILKLFLRVDMHIDIGFLLAVVLNLVVS
jgi:hypothetical protein